MKTVILAAGFGSRLWPISTSERPKQFQPLINGVSLLNYTYGQLRKVMPAEEVYVVVLDGMQPLVAEVLPEFAAANLIVVPERRNTLPHTLWALSTMDIGEDESVLFKSVDHFSIDEDAFLESLSSVLAAYDTDRFTLLCTRYKDFNSNDGYCIANAQGAIVKFLEKPSREELQRAAGDSPVYRSPFMYITSRRTMRDVIGVLPDPWVPRAQQVLSEEGPAVEQAFLGLPFLDISTAVFQQSKQLQLAEINYECIDVGRFQEIYTLNAKDTNGNVIMGKVLLDGECRNNLIINNQAAPLVVISRSDSVIVQTSAGSLLSSFSDASKVGEIYKKHIHHAG